ncbi:hypothetical protein HAX54_048550 [Datura stramonium]|uniref:Uncharacterized protein n=1 Tax=Datura stramonium TaxID=4076 RepID=A0ABS8WN60_DATST|nr:hypothetical protein [Datura stramonium]
MQIFQQKRPFLLPPSQAWGRQPHTEMLPVELNINSKRSWSSMLVGNKYSIDQRNLRGSSNSGFCSRRERRKIVLTVNGRFYFPKDFAGMHFLFGPSST